MPKLTMTSKCTSIPAHFKNLAYAPVICGVHRLMQHVQGYSGSHWTSPSGDYSLHIAPAVARATANKTTMTKCNNFAGHFNGHGGGLVQYHTHCPIEEVQGLTRSHWTLPLGKNCGR
jgi:hypothetical protein